jgi:mRNA interferase RelE/StbE
LKKLTKVFEIIEKSNSLSEIVNCKKMVGCTDYYRIKIGNYRLGLEVINSSTIRFIIIAHRKDIYNKFP